jgi:hypothetical protein
LSGCTPCSCCAVQRFQVGFFGILSVALVVDVDVVCLLLRVVAIANTVRDPKSCCELEFCTEFCSFPGRLSVFVAFSLSRSRLLVCLYLLPPFFFFFFFFFHRKECGRNGLERFALAGCTVQSERGMSLLACVRVCVCVCVCRYASLCMLCYVNMCVVIMCLYVHVHVMWTMEMRLLVCVHQCCVDVHCEHGYVCT